MYIIKDELIVHQQLKQFKLMEKKDKQLFININFSN